MIRQFIQMIQNGGNPQQLMINMLEQQSSQNPILGNLLQLVKKNDRKGIETFARNIAKERGIDFDKEFNSFRQNLGI